MISRANPEAGGKLNHGWTRSVALIQTEGNYQIAGEIKDYSG